MKLDKIEDVIADVREGKMVVIIDDADRENEGDLMIAAQKVNAEAINFMMQHGKGLICVSLTESRLQQLGLPFQVQYNTSPFGTNFAISFDHHLYSNLGNTAEARAFAIKAVTEQSAKADDFIKPGHVFPLGAVEGGVLKRRGQTEGSLDLSRLAGLSSAGVICEIMDQDGVMLRGESLQAYCDQHQLKITSVEDIVNYIIKNEVSLRRIAESDIDLTQSLLPNSKKISSRLVTYLDYKNQVQHYALVVGDKLLNQEIHYESVVDDLFSEFLNTDDIFKSKLKTIVEKGSGVLIYLREGADSKIAQFISKDLNSHTLSC